MRERLNIFLTTEYQAVRPDCAIAAAHTDGRDGRGVTRDGMQVIIIFNMLLMLNSFECLNFYLFGEWSSPCRFHLHKLREYVGMRKQLYYHYYLLTINAAASSLIVISRPHSPPASIVRSSVVSIGGSNSWLTSHQSRA